MSDDWTRLYLARWPNGAVTLLAADSLEHAADRLDEVGDAAECEVVPFNEDLWLTMRPSDDPGRSPLVLDHRPTLEIDSQERIIERAYPVLHEVIAASRRGTTDGDTIEEPIEGDRWRAATAMEAERIISPSQEWKAALEAWWEHLAPSSDD